MEHYEQLIYNAAGIHLYRCKWDDEWYGARQEFVFALDEQHARDIVEERFNYQNHVRALTVKEIPLREVKRVPRQEQVLVKEASSKRGEGIVKSQYYIDVTRYYCSSCHHQVFPGGDFCPECGGLFKKEGA